MVGTPQQQQLCSSVIPHSRLPSAPAPPAGVGAIGDRSPVAAPSKASSEAPCAVAAAVSAPPAATTRAAALLQDTSSPAAAASATARAAAGAAAPPLSGQSSASLTWSTAVELAGGQAAGEAPMEGGCQVTSCGPAESESGWRGDAGRATAAEAPWLPPPQPAGAVAAAAATVDAEAQPGGRGGEAPSRERTLTPACGSGEAKAAGSSQTLKVQTREPEAPVGSDIRKEPAAPSFKRGWTRN